MKKFLLSTIVAAAAVMTAPAQAITVVFGGQAATDGSGLTSAYVPANNVAIPGSGVFVETFDLGTNANGTRNCGLNTPSSLVTVAPVGSGTFGYRVGSTTNAAAPSGDNTCFAYGPEIGQPVPVTVNLNYTGLLNSPLGGNGVKPINYLGIYYGSIDNYNDLLFYNAGGALIGSVKGQDLINQFNCTSGDRTSNATNLYVNLFFSAAEAFTSFSFTTRDIAFEMDNVSVGFGVNRVPEPGSIALLGLGLAALGVSRRRTAKKA